MAGLDCGSWIDANPLRRLSHAVALSATVRRGRGQDSADSSSRAFSLLVDSLEGIGDSRGSVFERILPESIDSEARHAEGLFSGFA